MEIDPLENELLRDIAESYILKSDIALQHLWTVVWRLCLDDLWGLVQNILNAFRARCRARCHIGQLGEVFHWLKKLGEQRDEENNGSNVDTVRGNGDAEAKGTS